MIKAVLVLVQGIWSHFDKIEMAVFGNFSIKNKFWDKTKAVIVIELSPQFLTS